MNIHEKQGAAVVSLALLMSRAGNAVAPPAHFIHLVGNWLRSLGRQLSNITPFQTGSILPPSSDDAYTVHSSNTEIFVLRIIRKNIVSSEA